MNRKRITKRRKRTLLVIVLLSIISIGYAALTATLKINGEADIKARSFDVHFDHVDITKGKDTEIEQKRAVIDPTDNTKVDFEVKLDNLGDEYEFTVDAVNSGDIDAMITSVTPINLGSASSYLEATVTYLDGSEITEGQGLNVGNKHTYKVNVKYRDDSDVVPPTGTNTTVSMSFSVEYKKNNGTAADPFLLCKRATTLHNDGTHEFGNIGSGNTLTSGDAFDCDVNGNGEYDSETERFYYVTDLDTNTAVLIYYSNTYNGIPNNQSPVAYDLSGENWHGPTTAAIHLPLTGEITNKWRTTVLSSPRQIKTQIGTTSTDGGDLPQFNYSNYAARLLTTQEVVAGCSGLSQIGNVVTGELDTCTYLLENTKYSSSSYTYGYWLESPNAPLSYNAWYVTGDYRCANVYHVNVDSVFGVRPAIEILKSDIQL